MSYIEYRNGEYKDVFSLKKIWISCFNDTAKGFRILWKNLEKISRYYVACDNDMAIAALYHIPCTVDDQPCHYLFAAATLPEYRRKGIMTKLINFSLEDAVQRGEKISFLYPSEDKLYHFYGKLGYTKSCKRKSVALTRDELANIAEYGGFFVSLSVGGIVSFRNKIMKQNAVKFPDEFIKYTIAATKLYGGYTVSTANGYAFVEEDKYGECSVSELAASEKDVYVLLGELLENTNARKFKLNYPTHYTLCEKESIVNDGMMKCLSDYKMKEAYIGLRNQ